MAELPVFTYQTRLRLRPEQEAVLDAYAALFGKVERALFAAVCVGKSLNDTKREFLRRFGITAQQFNSARAVLEGNIASIRERRHGLIEEAKTRIRKAEQVIERLTRKVPGSNALHQKKRRLAMLQARLAALEADEASGKVRLCFGGRKLFRAQFYRKENGYADHTEWKAAWQRTRARQFFVLGSSDETAGNQSCQARLESDGAITLKLRLPDALGQKHVELTGVRFAYGQEAIEQALSSSRRIHAVTASGKATTKRIGQAISYRFLRDAKGWRVFVSVQAQPVEVTSSRLLGAIGVDINAGHLAVAEIDRFGNPVAFQRIDLPLSGKTAHQAKALIGDTAKRIVERAKAAGKPIVIERLDFARKKAELEDADPRHARMLSAFAYRNIIQHVKSAAFRAGVEVIEVNPAYTSVIGAVNVACCRGVSVHQGAAAAIARRGLGLSERPPRRRAVKVPNRQGGHVALVLPVRNRTRHVWSFWAAARKALAALQAPARSGTLPGPHVPAKRRVCSHRAAGVELPGANRAQRCSEHVLGDVPW